MSTTKMGEPPLMKRAGLVNAVRSLQGTIYKIYGASRTPMGPETARQALTCALVSSVEGSGV